MECTMTEQKMLGGQCLCGAVRVAARTETRDVGACHCGMCRRWGGGPLLAVNCGTEVRFDGLQHVAVHDSSDWAQRGFCRNCGTHLYYRLKESGRYFLPVGLFDEQRGWVLAEQVFVDEQPGYYAFSNETRRMTGAELFAAFAPPEG
jgi:hypothetical protein